MPEFLFRPRVYRKRLFFAALALALAAVQLSFAGARADESADNHLISDSKGNASLLPPLPPLPRGKSTVIGGAIRDVDPVRDQMTLKVYGGKSMKILFDERTQLFEDGKKISLRNLRSEDHASVETVLDGTDVFARSIHILSQAAEGECRGQVASYDPTTGELSIVPALSGESIRLRVPAGTPIIRTGQNSNRSAGASDLVKGTLLAVKFQSNNDGRGIARQISILATPGSEFVFAGNIEFLDMHSGILVIADPKDGSSYKISFDPGHFSVSQQLHQGARVRVTASFDGTGYVASAIAIE